MFTLVLRQGCRMPLTYMPFTLNFSIHTFTTSSFGIQQINSSWEKNCSSINHLRIIHKLYHTLFLESFYNSNFKSGKKLNWILWCKKMSNHWIRENIIRKKMEYKCKLDNVMIYFLVSFIANAFRLYLTLPFE